LARRHGWTDDQISNLHDFEKRSDFSESEKVSLRFAEQMTLDAHSIDDTLWSDLGAHFDEGEIVELADCIGMFNYVNRFNEALRIEPTK
jgi:alkylhydroperoxidase family enzyme